jgi:hypothetical protein
MMILVLSAAPAAAQDEVSLKWKLKEGEKFFAKNVTDMNMNMSVLGQTIDIKMKITTVQRFKVLAQTPNSTTIEMTVLAMDMESMGPPIPGLGAVAERMKNATLTGVLDQNMAVTKLEGYDKFLDKLADGDAATRKQMKQQFSETTMSQMFSEVFSVGTSKSVKVGETWTRGEKMEVAGLDASVKVKYKLDSVTSGVANIGMTGDVTFKAGGALPGLPEGVKIDSLDMKADKYVGKLKFDTQAGKLKENNQDSDMAGSMSMSAMGQKISVTMKINMKAKVTIEDKNPIKD